MNKRWRGNCPLDSLTRGTQAKEGTLVEETELRLTPRQLSHDASLIAQNPRCETFRNWSAFSLLLTPCILDTGKFHHAALSHLWAFACAFPFCLECPAPLLPPPLYGIIMFGNSNVIFPRWPSLSIYSYTAYQVVLFSLTCLCSPPACKPIRSPIWMSLMAFS